MDIGYEMRKMCKRASECPLSMIQARVLEHNPESKINPLAMIRCPLLWLREDRAACFLVVAYDS